MSADDQVPEPQPPRIQILHGNANAEEIAALTVLFAAMSGGGQGAQRRQQGWSHRRRTLNPGAVRGAGWGGPA